MRLGFNWSVALLLPIALIASDAYGDGYSNIEEVRNDLKGILDPLVDDGLLPGYYASVYDEDGLVIEVASGSASELEGLKPSSNVIYTMMSMSKPIVSFAVLRLVDAGLLGLDQPVKAFIPGMSQLSVVEDGDLDNPVMPLERDISVRDLLTHTAGFTYSEDIVGREEVAKIYAELEIFAIDKRFQSDLGDLSAHVDALLQLPLVAQPGEKFIYSVSIDVLGRLIELVTEQPLDQALRDLVLEPLGMTDTTFLVPKEKYNRLAAMYEPRLATYPIPGRFARYQPYKTLPEGIKNFAQGSVGYFSGGGGLASTAADYEKFLRAIVFGQSEGLLSDEMREQFFRNQLPAALGSKGLLYNFGPRALNTAFSYGFGIRLTSEGSPDSTGDHDYYFWAGAANTQFWIDRKNGRFGLFLAQHMPTQYDRARELVSASRKLVAE